MVVDHRTYNLKPGTLGTFLKLFQEQGLPVLTRHMGAPLGYFFTVIGPINQVVHLWGYESVEDMYRRLGTRDADPAWPEYASQAAQFLVSQENKVLLPAPFSRIK